MTVVLPNSIFYHLGRTGGHWVSHVLWRAGLVEARLAALHLTPAQAPFDPLFAPKPFTFCFVRHPLTWAASLWRHEMEFGWNESQVSDVARSDSFATFLERLLERWPTAPCSTHMKPFYEPCTFIGKQESLTADLARALTAAGERFDEAVLATPPMNESTVRRLREAARAPRHLLERVMAAESEFNGRFGYAGIPEALVAPEGWSPPPIWPVLPLSADADAVARLTEARSLDLERVTWAYRLSDGSIIAPRVRNERKQWAFVEAIEALPPGDGRKALVQCANDPYFAYLMSLRGYDVDFLCDDPAVLPLRLMKALAPEINVRTAQVLDASRTEATYDVVIAADLLEGSPFGESALAWLRTRMKPGAVLLGSWPVLQAPEAPAIKASVHEFAMPWAAAHFTPRYLHALLRETGFEGAEVLWEVGESPIVERREGIDRIARVLNTDEGETLAFAVVRARAAAAPLDWDVQSAGRVFGSVRDFLRLPTDGLSLAAERTIAIQAQELDEARLTTAALRQAVADREADLRQAREALAKAAVDTAFQLHAARIAGAEQIDALRAENQRLRTELFLTKAHENDADEPGTTGPLDAS